MAAAATRLAIIVAALTAPLAARADDVLNEHRDLRRRSGDAAESEVAAPFGTRVASKLAYYTDDDGLTVVTPIVSVEQKIFDTSSITLEYDADVLSAATVDVRTSATDKFDETRHGIALSGGHKIRSLETDLGGSVSYSRENDYQSVTVGGGFSTELLQKNVTVGAGYSYVYNSVGRSHTSLDAFEDHLDIHAVNASFTQLLSKRTYLQLSGSVIVARGYQASVYRYVPIFLEGTMDPAQLSEASLLSGAVRPLERLAERLPRDRLRGAAVARLNHAFDFGMTVAGDYRFYADDWAITSHTLSVNVYQKLPAGVQLRLRNRFYIQTEADFYQVAYTVPDAETRPTLFTMDRELSAFWYDMVGLKLSLELPVPSFLERVVLDLKGDLQYTKYEDFAYLLDRTAVIVGGGLTVEL